MASPGCAPLLLSLTLRLMRLIRLAFATSIAGAPVSPAQYRLLARLREGPATVSALAEWHSVTPPTATRVIDGLEERGWVERLRSDGDRRHVLVSLTEVGATSLRVLEEAGAGVLSEVLARLSADESAEVVRAMLALASALPAEAVATVDTTENA